MGIVKARKGNARPCNKIALSERRSPIIDNAKLVNVSNSDKFCSVKDGVLKCFIRILLVVIKLSRLYWWSVTIVGICVV